MGGWTQESLAGFLVDPNILQVEGTVSTVLDNEKWSCREVHFSFFLPPSILRRRDALQAQVHH